MEVLGFDIPLFWSLVTVIVIALYKLATAAPDMFARQGIKGPRKLPLLGTTLPMIRKGFMQMDEELIKEYGNLVSLWEFGKPTLMIADLELIKEVTIKKFNSFRNRLNVGGLDEEPTNSFLTILEDDRWRHVRNTVTPTFSGSKLRKMMNSINRCCSDLTERLDGLAKNKENFEARQVFGDFTMDVIASTSFGIYINCQKERDNIFVKMINNMLNGFGGFKILLLVMLPKFIWIFKKLGMEFFPKDSMTFFTEVVEKAMDERKANPDKESSDFLQLLIAARNNDEKGNYASKSLTKNEVIAQTIIFFGAGFETTATTVSFVVYLLALHPECQEKCHDEARQVLGDKTEFDYDDAKKLSYIEMCIEEAMRMYPAAPRTNRATAEDVEVGGIAIPKGTVVTIAAMCVHMNPDIWPEPEKYDPERFTPENKATFHPCQWLPFGQGPRNCVGMRLAMLEMKVAIAHMLLNFKHTRCSKTEVPLKLEKMRMRAENGIWLGVERRV